MLGKKRIRQKPAGSAERPQVKPGTPGQAEHPPTAEALIAVKQQLQREIADRKLGQDQFKIHLDRLEQRIKGQSGRLIETKEQLKHLREELTERSADIKAANEQLQQRVAQHEHRLNQKLTVLTRTLEQLQHKVADLSQKKMELLEDPDGIGAKQPADPAPIEVTAGVSYPAEDRTLSAGQLVRDTGLNPQELKALSELAKRLAQ